MSGDGQRRASRRTPMLEHRMSEVQDLKNTLAALSERAPFNQWLNLQVARGEPGEVELHLEWRPEFSQYSGFLHAGLIGGLIDTACGFAAFTMSGPVLASQFSVRCLRPAIAEKFVVTGRVVKAGRQQIFTSAELFAHHAPTKALAVGEALLVPVS